MGAKETKTNPKSSILTLKSGPPTASGSSPCGMSLPSGGFSVLAVVLGREILQGGKAVAARHVLLELLLQGFETDAVLLVGTELGDVEAGGVGHVDHVGVGQHDELIFLEEKRRTEGDAKVDQPPGGCPDVGSARTACQLQALDRSEPGAAHC